MRAWVYVADLVKTKHLDGGLVARSAAGLPFLLHHGATVAFVPPVIDAPRYGTVSSIRVSGDHETLVSFEEVSDVSLAEMLVGCSCLMRREDVDLALESRAEDQLSLDGWSVFDASDGYIGRVIRTEPRAMQPLLVVSGDRWGEVLIPYVEEFVMHVDEARSQLHMRLPSGLLDL